MFDDEYVFLIQTKCRELFRKHKSLEYSNPKQLFFDLLYFISQQKDVPQGHQLIKTCNFCEGKSIINFTGNPELFLEGRGHYILLLINSDFNIESVQSKSNHIQYVPISSDVEISVFTALSVFMQNAYGINMGIRPSDEIQEIISAVKEFNGNKLTR